MVTDTSFMPLEQIAVRLGVPASWLKSEAEAGRVPHIKAGRRVLFHRDTVERALAERATREVASVG